MPKMVHIIPRKRKESLPTMQVLLRLLLEPDASLVCCEDGGSSACQRRGVCIYFWRRELYLLQTIHIFPLGCCSLRPLRRQGLVSPFHPRGGLWLRDTIQADLPAVDKVGDVVTVMPT